MDEEEFSKIRSWRPAPPRGGNISGPNTGNFARPRRGVKVQVAMNGGSVQKPAQSLIGLLPGVSTLAGPWRG